MADIIRERRSQGPDTASRQIADLLWAEIRSGNLGPGMKLPSERQLMAMYDVARNTARAAVRHLVDRGLVVTEQGRGAFVRKRMDDLTLRLGPGQYTPTGDPLRELVEGAGGAAELVDLGVERVAPPAAIAERLEVRADRKSVIRRFCVGTAGGLLLLHEVAYIPWTLAKGTDLARAGALWPWQRYQQLEGGGHWTDRVREEVLARMPTPTEARDLGLPAGVPLFEVRHTGLESDGSPLEVTVRIVRADQAILDYTARVSE